MGRMLRREVETPQRQNTGLGVMLVASAAMFFAVAGSAFILRARMATGGCPHSGSSRASAPAAAPAEQPRVVEVEVAEQPADANAVPAGCGDAIYQNHPDGSVSIYFDLCQGSDGFLIVDASDANDPR